MIKIIYDQDVPGVEFAVARLLLYYGNKTQCKTAPSEVGELFSIAKADWSVDPYVPAQYQRFKNTNIFDEKNFIDKYPEEKLILVGMHPKNKEENRAILEFFKIHQDDIIMWLDNHNWPDPTRDMFEHYGGKNILIDKDLSLLEILSKEDFQTSGKWIQAEKNMRAGLANDPLSKRFLKAKDANKEIGKHLPEKKYQEFIVFNAIVHEIIFQEELASLTELIEGFKVI